MRARLFKVHTRPACRLRSRKKRYDDRKGLLGGDNNAKPLRFLSCVAYWCSIGGLSACALWPDGDTGVFGVPLRRGFLFDSSIGSFWRTSNVRTYVDSRRRAGALATGTSRKEKGKRASTSRTRISSSLHFEDAYLAWEMAVCARVPAFACFPPFLSSPLSDFFLRLSSAASSPKLSAW